MSESTSQSKEVQRFTSSSKCLNVYYLRVYRGQEGPLHEHEYSHSWALGHNYYTVIQEKTFHLDF